MSLWVRQRKDRSERTSRNWEQIYFGLCHGLSLGLGQFIPPSPLCLKLHCMSSAAELRVSPEHQEDEWLGSPLY